jgi:endonuclease-3
MLKAVSVVRSLGKLYGGDSFLARESKTRDPFRVLVSTILSQRTRDESTDKASGRLFSRYKTPSALARADVASIEALIRESGFYRTKARRIREVARIIHMKYGGRVPDTYEELVRLPGVGRKTANCVLLFGFGKNVIPVDTHVHRISNRLGLVRAASPEKTEAALLKAVPKKYWAPLNDLFVSFGKDLCKPIGPRCWRCPVFPVCEWEGRYERRKRRG